MDESGYTKLRISKGVNDTLKDVISRAKTNVSISQFAEEILLEACDAITSGSAPTLLPTVVGMRMKLRLPITHESNPLLDRIAAEDPPEYRAKASARRASAK